MLHGGAAQFSHEKKSFFTLTGLAPGASYDIWLASFCENKGLTNSGAVGEWSTTNSTTTTGPQKIDGRDPRSGSTWEHGLNYVRFQNVKADSHGNIVFVGQPADLSEKPGDEFRLPLSGFQIDPAAKPATTNRPPASPGAG
jgi:hypothetical protein